MVFGVSYDPIEDNCAFAKKFGFGYRLLSDLDHHMGMAYGASSDASERWPNRISYLVDRDGRIARVYAKVDVRNHAQQVLADLDELSG